MAKFKLIIKDSIGGDVVKEVEFEELIQAEAKNKFYDIFLDEATILTDGEYTGELFRWSPSKEQWDEVGAPVIACDVRAGKSELTVQRTIFSKKGIRHECGCIIPKC